MVGRWLSGLLVLMAALAPGQAAFALPDLPAPPPPKTPPPPPTGLRPMIGADGQMILDTHGQPQFVIDLPQAPILQMRPDNVPAVLMRHLAPGTMMAPVPMPVALPVPAAGQGLREVGQSPITAPPVPPSGTTPPGPPSTLPQNQSTAPGPVLPPPPSEGVRRPGGPQGR